MIALRDVAFRFRGQRRHPGLEGFRSSISCLLVPLSTLHWLSCDDQCMTRGQDGLLLLSCRTLSFLASCRFIPAFPPLTLFLRVSKVLPFSTFSAVNYFGCSAVAGIKSHARRTKTNGLFF